MTDVTGAEIVPPAYLAGDVQPFHLHDRDLLVVSPAVDYRFADAQAWAQEVVKQVKDELGWTVVAVVLPPGTGVTHYREVDDA